MSPRAVRAKGSLGARSGVHVRLYVAGDAPNSLLATLNLRALLAECPEVLAEVEIIDVLLDPKQGLRDGILVTPTLVKVAPKPARRIIGNLCDRTALLAALGLGAHPHD